jgi:hypothetical protein
MSFENKTLKFSPDLVPLVLSDEKYLTWRLWDDKDLKEGDMVTLIRRPGLTAFAVAKITRCTKKLFGELTEEDKRGHEPFKTDVEMYETYTGYYKRKIGPETPLKVLKFEILQKL